MAGGADRLRAVRRSRAVRESPLVPRDATTVPATYLLDTSAVSEYFKRVGATYERFQAHAPHELSISSLTEHEMRFGLALKPGATRLAALVRSFLQVVEVLPFDPDDAAASADVQAALGKAGTSIGDLDVLIAGVALARDRVLVTSNVKHFSKVPGLAIENWRSR